MTQESLNQTGLETRHKFQVIAVRELLSRGWQVSTIREAYGVAVVVLRMKDNTSIGAAVYPDGSFGRSAKPTIEWSWDRARRAAEATVPDKYVSDILERDAKEAANV